MEKPARQISEETTRKFLMSLDTKLIEEAIRKQKLESDSSTSDSNVLVSPAIDEKCNYFSPSRRSSFVGSMAGNGLVAGKTTNIQPQMNMALSVAENLISRSPSLRRVSVKQDESSKDGFFGKKKAHEPSLVFTFAGQDSIDNDNATEKKNNDLNSVISDGSGSNSLSVAASTILDNTKLGSLASFRTAHTQVSTIEEERRVAKKQRFFDFLTMVISICYGIFVMSSSLGIYCSDLLLANSYEYNNTEIWNLFLSSSGILLLLWLIFDIQSYLSKISKLGNSSSFFDNLKLVEGPDGELNIELPLNHGKKKNVPEYYAFSIGRHAGSFFLKIGAAFFCFGHLIHMGLNFVKHIYSMTGDDAMIEKYCGQKEGLAYDIIYPLFSLVQLYFIFKYGNVIVNKNKWLARFTFMHCLSSSLSFWMNTLINETLDAIVKKYFAKKVSNCYDTDYNLTTITTLTTSASTLATNTPNDDYLNTYHQPISGLANYELAPCEKNGTTDMANNIICVIETRAMCNNGENAAAIFSIAPWLYPFSIEFSILVVAIWYVLWTSIGQIQEHKHTMEFLPSITPQGSMDNLHQTEGHKQAKILFADCSSSNMGMFFGVVLMVFVVVSSIFVIVKEGDCDPTIAITTGNMLKMSVLSILILASIYTYYVIAQFDVNPDPISFLDDMLLFLCLPSFFLYSIICLGPTILGKFELDFFLVNILTLLQILIQTPMIVDGLRRCSNSVEAQRKMKGRNMITFLIVANLAVYVMETLMIKSYDYQTIKIEFYGPDAWTVLSHATLPICIFYRFHSAVALVDIWNSAYKAPEHH